MSWWPLEIRLDSTNYDTSPRIHFLPWDLLVKLNFALVSRFNLQFAWGFMSLETKALGPLLDRKGAASRLNGPQSRNENNVIRRSRFAL